MSNIVKKQLLFLLKDNINKIPIYDLKEIFTNLISFKAKNNVIEIDLYNNIVVQLETTCSSNKFVIRYYKNDLLHRDNDQPAVNWYNHMKAWWTFGYYSIRKNNQPTVIYSNGQKYYYDQYEFSKNPSKLIRI